VYQGQEDQLQQVQGCCQLVELVVLEVLELPLIRCIVTSRRICRICIR
jgi:hypothetical protein